MMCYCWLRTITSRYNNFFIFLSMCVSNTAHCITLQAISLLEQEKGTLVEKLANAQQDLADLNVKYDRLNREAQTRAETDRSNIISLQGQLKDFRQQFEEDT